MRILQLFKLVMQMVFLLDIQIMEMWKLQGIAPKFTVLKHRLSDVKIIFPLEECYHVGDTDVDRMYSESSGFVFVESGLAETWISGL